MLQSISVHRRFLAAIVVSLLGAPTAFGQTCPPLPPTGEFPPGRIFNPPGLTFFQQVAYNSDQDYYLVVYHAGSARAFGLTPDGTVLPEKNLSPNNVVQDVAIAYNPDRNEFLVTWRYDDPVHVYARYLDGNGNPLGNPMFFGTGSEARVAYSPTSQKYMVIYSGIGFGVKYRMVAGDSTSPNPVSGETLVDGPGFSARVAYGSANNRFLITYVRDFAPPTRSEVWGRLFTGDGAGIGGVIGIGTGTENQQIPEVGYASSSDQFMVSFEDWSTGGFPDVQFHLVRSDGLVSGRLNLTGSGGVWDVPGPITYNSSTGKLTATWFETVYGRYRDVTPGPGTLGTNCAFSYLNAYPLGIAARPDPADPQALVAFRNNLGEDGIHVSIIHLPPPPPSFSSTVMPDGFFQQAYSQKVPVVGGTPPLSFQLLSGSPPPGLTGPNPSTGFVNGTPTTLGTFPSFRVKVTDGQGRTAEADLTMTVKLPAPTPTSPNSDVNTLRPTFTWSASAGATSYNVEINNLSDGGTINIPGVATTSVVPPSDLPANKNFRWRVQAAQGANLSPFSIWLNFRTDMSPGSTIVLSGNVPGIFTPLGMTAIASSGESSPSTAIGMTVDGNVSTFWSTPARVVMQLEFLTLDLGSPQSINNLRMRSRDTAPLVFPKDFQIQVSTDNVNYTTVATLSDFSATASTWYDFPFPPTQARYIRIWVTESGKHTNNLFYVQIAEVQASLGVPALNSIGLTWAAPGDDGATGTASSYDIRYRIGMTIGNFDTATPVNPDEPAPAPAGTIQSFTQAGLASETFYAFAAKSLDNAGNISNISNTVVVATTGVAPESITDLATQNPGLTSIGVTWHAPNEDGPGGGAVSEYDLRWATFPITAANFGAATPATGEPDPPAGPGALESMTVSGLSPNTHYFFAIQSVDDVGNLSPISNVATGDTLDNVLPGAITNLTGTPGAASYTKINGIVALSTLGDSFPHVKERAVDADLETLWSSQPRNPMQNEHFTIDLGSSQPVGRLRMRSRSDNGNFMPVDFTIQVSADNVNFTNAFNVTAFSSPAATWHTFSFPSVSGRYVRILATRSNVHTSGFYYVQIAEIEVFRFDLLGGGVTLQWTAPGDDGMTGTAASYQFRHAASQILTETDWLNATPVSPGSIPAPLPAGTVQSLSVFGLGTETVLWWAAKVVDERPNVSPLSNSVKVSTPGTAPAAVNNLQITNRTSNSIQLSWTATGDNGTTGTAAAYDLRRSTSPINNLVDFEAATQIATPPPLPAGSPEQFNVTGLSNETTYYFAIRVIDDADLMSPPSNVVNGATLDGMAPGTIANLTAAFPITNLVKRNAMAIAVSGTLDPHAKERAVDADFDTLWSSPARDLQQVEFLTVDLGQSYSVGRVRLRSRADNGTFFPRDFEIQVSTDGVAFSIGTAVNNFSANAATWYNFDFPPKIGRYVRVLVTEANPNPSNGKFYVQIAELEAYEGGLLFDRAVLGWTAPGDNGTQGTATAYDIRFGNCAGFNFDTAIAVLGEPAPAAPGTSQSFTVMPLPAESTLCFAIKTLDEVPNTSLLSNLPSLVTPPVPPAAVGDLAAGAGAATSVPLTWHATGDDGTIGRATSYDVRYRTLPIVTDADWDVASQATGEPAPADPGVVENFPVTGLASDTLYYFALKVMDEAGGMSPRSNVVSRSTADSQAPAAVTNLAAIPGGISYSLRPATTSASSGELDGYPRGLAVDANMNTFWSTPGRAIAQQEFLTLDLGSVQSIGRSRLRSRSDLGTSMPRDFEFQVSTDGTVFTTVHEVDDFVASPATWYTFDFAPASGRYLKLLVTETNPHATSGLFYVQIAEMEAYSATILADRATLTWTSPGDNGIVGTASSYDVRYSASPILDNGDFAAATPVNGEPAPKPAGSLETFVVQGLPGETTLHFALKTSDDGGNISLLSNDASVVMPPIPPAPVLNLAAGTAGATTVQLNWTATGDDGALGTATAYDVRYRTTPFVTAGDFNTASQASGEPSPDPSGSPETFTVTGLAQDTLYYFALKVVDDAAGTSPLSNVVSQRTDDDTAPGAISDLAGVGGGITYTVRAAAAVQVSGQAEPHVKENAVDGNNDTIWSTPGRTVMQQEFIVLDIGAPMKVGRVRLRSRADLGTVFPRDFQFQVSSDGVNFTPVHTVNNFTATAATWYSFDFTPATGRFVRLLVTESNAHTTGLFYVQIAAMEVSQATTIADRVTLSWTATGDNGATGTAASYDVRFRTVPINNDSDFAAANQASGEPVPQVAGSPESFVVTGLAANSTYYFAVKVTDDSGNTSLLSNVVSVTTPPP